MGKKKHFDSGWAWVVITAGFCAQFLTMGQIKCYGILLIELMGVFKASATLVQWISGLAQGLAYGMAPITCGLVNRFGHRRVVITGACIAGVGLSLGFFANSLSVLFVTYGLLFGFGVGFIHNPTLSIVPFYFKKHISFSSSFVISGSALGAFVFPLLLEWLLRELNYKATFLICGALVFNVIVTGAVMRPVDLKKVTTKPPPKSKDPEKQEIQSNSSTRETSDDKANLLTKKNANENDNRLPSTNKQYGTLTPPPLTDPKPGLEVTTISTDTAQAESEESSDIDRGKLHFFHWSVLKDPYCLLYVGARTMYMFSSIMVYVLLPIKVQELGDNDKLEATFVSMMSLSELIARILWGIFFDRKRFRTPAVRQYGMAVTLLLGGIDMFLMGTAKSMPLLGVFAVFMGVMLAGAQAPNVPILVDILGTEKSGDGLGLVMLGQAIILIIGPLITGPLLDSTGSVKYPYMVMGASWFIACGFCLALRSLYYFNVKHAPGIIPGTHEHHEHEHEHDEHEPLLK